MTETLSRSINLAAEGPVPPQALDAERAVLAALLLDHEATGRTIELMEPSAFYRVAHQRIYEAILALYNRNEKADLVTLTEELRMRGDLEAVGGVTALTQILDYATTSANLEQHAKIVHAKAVLRALIRASTEIQQECYAGGDETALILDRAEQRIFEITDERVRQGFVALKDLVKPAIQHIQTLSERKVFVTGVTSGYADLDEKTAGFQNSDLIVIAGRPGMGKTSFALNIAENASIPRERGVGPVPVAVFSLEMSKEQLVLRLLCSLSEIGLHKLRNGYISHEDWPRLIAAADQLSKAPIVIDDSAVLTVMEIRAKCRRLKAEGKLGLVVIDYLQLIRASGPTENRVQEISQITRGLKALAKELNAPIIALSQLSRAVETRDRTGRPQLSDLRESGCLTEDTTIVRADTGTPVTMGELYGRGERNIPVWSLDEDLRVVRRTMTHVFSSGVKPVFRLTLASGLEVKASGNHPFLTLDGWRPLSDLAPGMRLATPRRLPCSCVPRELKVIRKASYRELYHLHITGAKQQLRFIDGIGIHGARAVRAAAVAAHLREILPNTNVDTIPIDVWNEVWATMTERRVTTREMARGLGMADCGAALYKSAPSRERMTRVATVLQDSGLHRLVQSDVFWDRIVAIEPIGEQEVFDATVPGSHNFIANGIVAHNSIEQDSDVVLFVYREVVYKHDTPEPLKAQILIAKQRNGPTGEVDLTFLRDCTKFVPYSPIMPGETEPAF